MKITWDGEKRWGLDHEDIFAVVESFNSGEMKLREVQQYFPSMDYVVDEQAIRSLAIFPLTGTKMAILPIDYKTVELILI